MVTTFVGRTWIYRIVGIAGFARRGWSSRTEGISLTSIINPHLKPILPKCTHILYVFQGEPGSSGLRGPEGAAGVGIQGEKVLTYFHNY